MGKTRDSGKIRLFADDTNLFFSSKSIPSLQSEANKSLSNLFSWFSANKLTINADKTCFTLFSNSKRKTTVNLFLNGTPINSIPVSKYLGIYLDENLNWKDHINHITGKLNQLTAAFYNLAKYIDIQSISKIYYAYVFLFIKYGIEIYGACDPTTMKTLQTAQNKVLKILYHKNRQFSTNQLHSELSILKCEDVYKLFVGVFVFKQQHDLLPNIFSNYYILNRNIHHIQTRNSANLFLPRYRLMSSQKSIKYTGAKIWNSIPNSIKNNTVNHFKSKYKNHLINNYVN